MPTQLAASRRYVRAQSSVRSRFLTEYVLAWRVLDPADPATFVPWLRLVAAIVERYRLDTGREAQAFVRTGRELATGHARGGVEPELRELVQLDHDVLVRNLLRTSVGRYGRAQGREGLTPVQAQRSALATSSANASRLVLDAGRDYVQRAIELDDRALGYMRVTDGHPCAFCSMLASRGAVYKSRAAAGADATRGDVNRYHDDCGCQVVPVYTRTPELPRASREADELWTRATRGLSGNRARNAFRRAVEGRPIEGDPILAH